MTWPVSLLFTLATDSMLGVAGLPGAEICRRGKWTSASNFLNSIHNDFLINLIVQSVHVGVLVSFPCSFISPVRVVEKVPPNVDLKM